MSISSENFRKTGFEGDIAMNKRLSDNYLKIVEWSEEDQCYIGTSPGLFIGGVHGKYEAKVFKDLCEAVEDTIRLLKKEGRPLPKATASKKFSGKIALRITPELHKSLAVRAFQTGKSINKLIQHKLEASI